MVNIKKKKIICLYIEFYSIKKDTFFDFIKILIQIKTKRKKILKEEKR